MLILVAGADPSRWLVAQKALAGRHVVSFAVDLRGTLDLVARQQPPVLLLCSPLLDADIDTCLEQVSRQSPQTRIVVIRDEPAKTGGGDPPASGRPLAPHSCIEADSAPRLLRPLVEAVAAEPSRPCREGATLSSRPDAAAQRGPQTPCARAASRATGAEEALFDFPAARPMVLGTSAAMRHVADVIRRVAPTDVTVLLHGESGTGKELFARRIHCMSERARGPFRAVSLPAVPVELFESTMFGHERGAFTGAVNQSLGAFEKADHGTLFLDEVSSLKLECQPKLLRAIQEREIERVGAREASPCDVRIIAATNVDLRDMVGEQRFRDDLYHRLSVITIELPPLRRRAEDIPQLVDFFLRRYARTFRCEQPAVSAEAMQQLQRYRWPGNVRELENAVQRALLLARTDRPLCCEDFLLEEQGDGQGGAGPIRFSCCRHALSTVEQAYIEQVLEHTQGNQSRAAQILQIDRKTLRAKLQRYSEGEPANATAPVVLRSA